MGKRGKRSGGDSVRNVVGVGGGVDWINLARNIEKGRAVVNLVIYLQFRDIYQLDVEG